MPGELPLTHSAFEVVNSSAYEFKVIFKSNEFKDEVQSYVDCSSLYSVPPYLESKELPFNLTTLKEAVLRKSYLKKGEEVEEEDKDAKDAKADNEKSEEASAKDDEGQTKADAIEDKDVKENGKKEKPKEEDALTALVAILEIKFADVLKMAEDMIKDNKITFALLPYIFKKKTQVYGTQQGSKYGAEISDVYFGESFLGAYFCLTLNSIFTDGEKFHTTSSRRRIFQFEGMQAIKSLPFQLMDEPTREYLTNRGEMYIKYGLGYNFLNYQGNLLVREGCFEFMYRADGRVMIDARNFKKFNPGYDDNDDLSNGMDEVPQEKLFLCKHAFKAFSFYAKKWGEVLVENLTQIKFMDDVFTRLVLSQEKKKIIQSVIRHSDNTFADVIGGKGGGIIFLFHGSPGVGKTLTAEAVAEMLHTPLYVVSVGELGTDAASLEKNLREILEVSRAWNAVALIDEADIFLERRTERDINRNAMVGVFLRMLEYHQGILILTTNRAKSFDEAFFSRITLAFKYEDLDGVARHDVWKSLLAGANISKESVDLDTLAAHDLNGRQIKNVIKIAQAIALDEKVPIATTHLETAIGFTTQFANDCS